MDFCHNMTGKYSYYGCIRLNKVLVKLIACLYIGQFKVAYY